MRVAVTGASGFVGGAVARALVADGHRVWTYSRRPARISGAEHRRWDLRAGPAPTVAPVDVVVHAAAAVGDGGMPAAAFRVNVDGTRAVREAFPGARFVYVSSGSVYDPRRPTVLGRESDAPVARYLNAYGSTKAAAERYLAASAREDRGPVVILRPHAVYGPGDMTLLPRIEAAVRHGLLPLPAGGRVRQHLTHVDTFVAAALAAARVDLPGPGPHVVNVADRDPVILRDLLIEALARRGHPVRVVDLPVVLARLVAPPAEAWASLRGTEPRMSRYLLSHLAMERTFDLARMRDLLGLDPPPTTLAGAEAW